MSIDPEIKKSAEQMLADQEDYRALAKEFGLGVEEARKVAKAVARARNGEVSALKQMGVVVDKNTMIKMRISDNINNKIRAGYFNFGGYLLTKTHIRNAWANALRRRI